MKASAALILSLFATAASAGPPAAATFLFSRGGSVSAPVAVDGYVYLSTGSTVTAWNRGGDGSLTWLGDSGTTPARGAINALARNGDYLYASYRGYAEGTSGVAVYSIADRAHPQLLGQYGYTNAEFQFAGGIAVAAGHVYVFDNEQGVFASPLTSPAVPTFTQVNTGWGNYDTVTASGNKLYAVGRTFLSSTALKIFDLTNPLAPQQVGSANLDGYDNFRLKIQPPFAYGFGLALNVSDMSDPANITPRGRADSPVAYEGLVLGTHAWGVGLDGLDIWNIANPDQPTQLGHSIINTFATDATAVLDGGDALLATRADRFVRLDASQPATPAVRSEAMLPAGTAAYDIAVRGDTAWLLGNAYGLNVANASDLSPVARFETSLEPSLQGRAFEQLAVDGNRAYLTSWGSGLVIADLANPTAPAQIGFWEYPFATAIAARGNRAWVGRSTNGGEVVALDVTNAAQPQVLGALQTSKVLRLALHGDYLYVADEAQFGSKGGGLLVMNIAAGAPAFAGSYAGCGTVRDVALSTNGRRALIACDGAAHLVDLTNPTQPQQLGTYPGAGTTVALQGNHGFIATDSGLDEVDFTTPAQPQLLHHWDLPMPISRLQVGADARVYALTMLSGVQVFAADRLFADGLQ